MNDGTRRADVRASSHDHPRTTHRLVYGGAAALTIAVGLASRRVTWLFPAALGKYPGDALYAVLAYWLLAMALPRLHPVRTAGLCTLFCFAIEAGQLWHPPWLDAIRATMLGHLVLGSSFAAGDLLAYAVGACAAAAIEMTAIRLHRDRGTR